MADAGGDGKGRGSRTVNATVASLLGFLHAGPMTGWELVAEAEQQIGDFWSLTRSQVYRELTQMEASGLIVAGERGPRDRRPYTIAKAGREAFLAWAAQEPEHESIRYPLLLRVLFGQLMPPEVLRASVSSQRAEHAARLTYYQQVMREVERNPAADPYRTATLEFGLAYERAVVRWFDRVLPGILDRAEEQRGRQPSP